MLGPNKACRTARRQLSQRQSMPCTPSYHRPAVPVSYPDRTLEKNNALEAASRRALRVKADASF
eukprot:13683705-Alexandrium_andersonii.AAC.1